MDPSAIVSRLARHCAQGVGLAPGDDARPGALDERAVVRRRPDFVAAEAEKPFAERLPVLLPVENVHGTVHSTSVHDPQKRIVHAPLLLAEVKRRHRRHRIRTVGVVRPIAVAALDDKALRPVADKPIAPHVDEQHVAGVIDVRIAGLVFRSSNLPHDSLCNIPYLDNDIIPHIFLLWLTTFLVFRLALENH